MVSAQNTAAHPQPQLRLHIALQVLISLILLPIESFLAAHITQTVCDYIEPYRRPMTVDDLSGFVLLVGFIAALAWLKERIGICWGLIVITSLLVTLSVCMDVWQLRMP